MNKNMHIVRVFHVLLLKQHLVIERQQQQSHVLPLKEVLYTVGP